MRLSAVERFLSPVCDDEPLPVPPAKPFDLDAVCETLASLPKRAPGNDYYGRPGRPQRTVRFTRVKLSVQPSLEESLFWLTALETAEQKAKVNHESVVRTTRSLFEARLAKPDPTKTIAIVRAGEVLPLTTPLMWGLLGTERLIDWLLAVGLKNALLNGRTERRGRDPKAVLSAGFLQHVRPYLTAVELAAAREAVDRPVTKLLAKVDESEGELSADIYQPDALAVHLAVALGMVDRIREWLPAYHSRIDADLWGMRQPDDIVSVPSYVFSVLDSFETAQAGVRRTSHAPWRQAQTFPVRTALVARYGGEVAESFADAVKHAHGKKRAVDIVRDLARIAAPRVAEPMLRCLVKSKAREPAGKWLRSHIRFGVQGLVGAGGRKGVGGRKLAEAAIDFYRDAMRAGAGELIEAAVAAHEPPPGLAKSKWTDEHYGAERIRFEVLDRSDRVTGDAGGMLDDASTPSWLTEAVSEFDASRKAARKRTPKRPDWLATEAIEPLTIDADGRRLDDDQIVSVLTALKATASKDETEAAAAGPLLAAIVAHVDGESRDRFVWSLLGLWERNGAPARDRWLIAAAGRLGDDRTAIRLAGRLREWSKESLHQRARLGLDGLRAIGTTVALSEVAELSRRRTGQLAKRAGSMLDEIAAERGIGREVLDDQLVPTCGLDRHGRRTFSYGPRSFRLQLDGALEPTLQDETGKVRKSLPRPTRDDDPEAAALAAEDWKQTRKQVRAVVEVQTQAAGADDDLRPAVGRGRRSATCWSSVP